MDNLVFACTDALDQPITPSCTTDYGERVIGVAFMKKGGTFAVACDYNSPTKAEFDVAIAAGEVAYYTGISNGHRIEQGATELSGDDTITGGTERYDVQYRIEGRIKLLDSTIQRGTEKLDRYSQLRAWFITDKNYCFGGSTGYLVSPNFSEIIFEGKGQPPYISFFVEYTATGEDYARYDADYDILTN